MAVERDQGPHRDPEIFDFPGAAEIGQVNDGGAFDHRAAQLFQQASARHHGASGGNQVVDEQYALALALQQSIGRDRRAHFNGFDQPIWNARENGKTQTAANARNGCIIIGLWIFREQFMDMQMARAAEKKQQAQPMKAKELPAPVPAKENVKVATAPAVNIYNSKGIVAKL